MGDRRVLLVAALVALAAAAAACGESGAETKAQRPEPTTTTTLPEPADAARPARLLEGAHDVPNPFVLVEDGTWYLYASQEHLYFENLPVRTSTDGKTLSKAIETMPELPAWVDAGFTWAPDVRRIDDRYVMWFTARLKGYDGPPTQCIGVAVADDPLGPFEGEQEPRICQLERRGSIDARSYEAPDGQLWLHWKSDDNADVDGTTKASIYAAKLAPDGIELDDEWHEILTADQPWEGRIVEAPQLVEGGGALWLFYSGNWFNQEAYGIGAALCETPAGPCTKPFDRPWLGSNAQGAGPGEASLFTDDGRTWIVYAPWAVEFETATPRPVALAHVAFGPFGPYLATL